MSLILAGFILLNTRVFASVHLGRVWVGTCGPKPDTHTRVGTRANTLLTTAKHLTPGCECRVHPGVHLNTQHLRPGLVSNNTETTMCATSVGGVYTIGSP